MKLKPKKIHKMKHEEWKKSADKTQHFKYN